MSEPIVSRDPAVQSGAPCIRGKRIPVWAVRSFADTGGWESAVKAYPTLATLTDAERVAVLAYPLWDFERAHYATPQDERDDWPEVKVWGHGRDELRISEGVDSTDIRMAHIDLLIAYLTAAQTAYQDHLERVKAWEQDQED